MSPSQQRTLDDLLESHLARQRASLWWGMIAGGVLTLIAAQLLVVNPLQKDMHAMKARIAMLEGGVGKLVGNGDPISEANSLLGQIKRQRVRISTARLSLREIEDFRADVEAAASNLGTAHACLNQIDELRHRVSTARSQIAAMDVSVQQMRSLLPGLMPTDWLEQAAVTGSVAISSQRRWYHEATVAGALGTVSEPTIESGARIGAQAEVTRIGNSLSRSERIANGWFDLSSVVDRATIHNLDPSPSPDTHSMPWRNVAMKTLSFRMRWIGRQWQRFDIIGRFSRGIRSVREMAPIIANDIRRGIAEYAKAWAKPQKQPVRVANPIDAPRPR